MNNRLKQAFDSIQAEAGLKEQTKAYIAGRIHNPETRKKSTYRRLLPVMACLFLLAAGFGGYRLYFTQTSIISIDVNPSMELNINRFGRVISVSGFNEDGRRLADKVDIRFMDYVSAVDEILSTNSIALYLSRDEMVSISVVGRDERESRKMLADIEACFPDKKNVCCYMGSFDEADAAHLAGLSFGKYCAFLELQEVDPDVTADDVKGLTMRQIRERIGACGGGTCGENTGECGYGRGHRHRRRTGR